LEQPFIKDESKTVEALIQEAIATIGENIQIGKFARISIGG
jgi:elongation factor Ts